jgi:molybdopterin-guanine dinucleotide biosynthesis protein A
MTSAVVLAGGASRRFGGDKLLADLDGSPLLHHALHALAAVADPIVVVLAPDAPEPPIPGALASAVSLARDPDLHQGPLAGVAAGLLALADLELPGDAPAIVVGGDMPHLVPGVLALLAATLEADPATGAATLEADPACVLPLALRPSLARPSIDALLRSDRRALLALLDSLPTAVVPAAAWRALDPAGRTLDDVDTRADLERR